MLILAGLCMASCATQRTYTSNYNDLADKSNSDQKFKRENTQSIVILNDVNLLDIF